MIMNDKWIVEQCLNSLPGFPPTEKPQQESMIYPFYSQQITKKEVAVFSDTLENKVMSEKIVSFGLSSFGYDVRIDRQFKVFVPFASSGPLVVDPKIKNDGYFQDFTGDSLVIPPHSYALGKTVEYIRVPEDILIICIGKSTYARCGIIANTTPLEPGWHGEVTIEIANTTGLPARIHANEGIMQLLFFKGNAKPLISYATRNGKYQGQIGVTTAKV